jgi:hypothetical protein
MICTSACPSDGTAARKAQQAARRRLAASVWRDEGNGVRGENEHVEVGAEEAEAYVEKDMGTRR